MMKKMRPVVIACSVAAVFSASAVYADTIKIAVIDTMSGAFAPLGQNQLNTFRMATEIANQQKWAGNHSIEVTAFDGKGSPQESLIQLKTVIDQGYRYIAQGNGSGVALALLDAINKHNERNPGKEIVYLNHAAIDPDLTNAKCSFWHFRFDANSDMKMEALTTYVAKDQAIKKVYIIGQNYAHGHQVTRAAKDYLKRKRPDIQIVGDDLHPIGTVKDFSPYIAKIKAAGADSVITGNWGADLALLVKAAKDASLTAKFYTYYAGTTGVPAALGGTAAGFVRQINYWIPNNETFSGKEYVETFKKKYNDDFYVQGINTMVQMVAKAAKDTNSVDPVKVALALEGMKVKAINGDVEMRKVDHQIQQPLYISTWTKVDGKKVKYDQENTGFGWSNDIKLDTYVATQPTSCQMKRPN